MQARLKDINNDLKDVNNVCENQRGEIIKLRGQIIEIKSPSSGIYNKHLRNIIESVLEYIGLKDNEIDKWTKLLILTVATESDNGTFTRQVNGPARSIFQVEPETEKEAMKWACKHRKEMYEKIKKLRCKAHLSVHEGEYNIGYATALAYIVYLSKGVKLRNNSNAEDLAKIHKKYYNTIKGKGSVKRTLAKLKEFRINL